jgi:hypothetical protein
MTVDSRSNFLKLIAMFSILFLLITNTVLLYLSMVACMTPIVICSIISFIPIIGLIAIYVKYGKLWD